MKQFPLSSYLLPRIRDIVFLIIFSIAMAAGWRTLNMDGDLPRHLLMGRMILESRSVPRQEMFSYPLEGKHYVAHEWLAQLTYYLFYRTLGLKGVVFLTAILIASAFLVLYSALSKEYEERFLMAIFVLWGAANTYQHWIARPHLFTLFFLAVWLILVDKIARGKKINLWFCPLIMMFWANIHAEFVSGFLVLLAYMAGWGWDFLFDRQNANPQIIGNLVIAFTLSFLATLLNPFGLRTWAAILSYLGNNYLMNTIRETRPPDFSSPAFFIEFSLIVVSLLILALKKGRYPSGRSFLIAGFTALALTSGRNIHLYGVVAPFVLIGPAIEIIDPIIKKASAAMVQIENKLRGFVWPVVILIAFLTALISGAIGKSYYFDSRLFPVDAVNWLEQNPQSGHMFNDFTWGGYIVWRLWPNQKDFIDSHTDVIGEITKMYNRVKELDPGWQEVFEEYDIQWVIMPVDSPLGQELSKSGWKIIYQDATAIILRKE